MKIVVGSDHGGLDYKQKIIKHLKKNGHEIIDVGTNSLDSCHYPLYAFLAGEKVASKEADKGILVCTTGEGIMIAANKIKGVRCGLGYDDEATSLTRQHNDANMIAFGQKFMKLEDVLRRVDIFINTEFLGERHAIRVKMINDYENI